MLLDGFFERFGIDTIRVASNLNDLRPSLLQHAHGANKPGRLNQHNIAWFYKRPYGQANGIHAAARGVHVNALLKYESPAFQKFLHGWLKLHKAVIKHAGAVCVKGGLMELTFQFGM